MRKDNLLYINGKDAWLTWSAMLVDDSYDNLLLPAGPKAYIENNFSSQSGKQVFFNNPKPMDRNVQLVLSITCNSKDDYLKKYNSLISEIYNGPFELKVIPLQTAYMVYLPENGFISLGLGLGMKEGKLSIRVNEPNPEDRTSINISAKVLATPDAKALTDQNNLLTEQIK